MSVAGVRRKLVKLEILDAALACWPAEREPRWGQEAIKFGSSFGSPSIGNAPPGVFLT